MCACHSDLVSRLTKTGQTSYLLYTNSAKACEQRSWHAYCRNPNPYVPAAAAARASTARAHALPQTKRDTGRTAIPYHTARPLRCVLGAAAPQPTPPLSPRLWPPPWLPPGLFQMDCNTSIRSDGVPLPAAWPSAPALAPTRKAAPDPSGEAPSPRTGPGARGGAGPGHAGMAPTAGAAASPSTSLRPRLVVLSRLEPVAWSEGVRSAPQLPPPALRCARGDADPVDPDVGKLQSTGSSECHAPAADAGLLPPAAATGRCCSTVPAEQAGAACWGAGHGQVPPGATCWASEDTALLAGSGGTIASGALLCSHLSSPGRACGGWPNAFAVKAERVSSEAGRPCGADAVSAARSGCTPAWAAAQGAPAGGLANTGLADLIAELGVELAAPASRAGPAAAACAAEPSCHAGERSSSAKLGAAPPAAAGGRRCGGAAATACGACGAEGPRGRADGGPAATRRGSADGGSVGANGCEAAKAVAGAGWRLPLLSIAARSLARARRLCREFPAALAAALSA